MQLVAYGAQDIYLTGNPQITFFKVVYRRHTNFSMEAIEQTINGTVGAGTRTTTTISRNGDLVSGLFFKIAPCDIVAASGDNPGHNMLDSVELEIGGQRIDRHQGHWMEVHAELYEENPGTVAPGAASAVPPAGATKFQGLALAGGVTDAAGTVSLTDAHYVPLRFWFCRNPGLALPLIALQYHEVKLIVNWSAANGAGSSTLASNVSVWADYVYLDTDERRRFAQVSHEYLIEQVQDQEGTASTKSTDLNFNHPVKEIIWVGKGGQAWGAANAGAGVFTDVAGTNWQIKLNGHDRFAEQDTNYFTKLQVWKHHTGCGGKAMGSALANTIAVYSFALKPEEHQPSGTCNFSRIDNAELKSSAAASSNGLHIYAVNYNVLRIMSGMGGLAYSN
jgi:hypothetical protein